LTTITDRRSLSAQLSEWKALYQHEFDIRLGEIVLPSAKDCFERLIIVASDLTIDQVLVQCGKHYPILRGMQDSSFDKIVSSNKREPYSSYAVTTSSVSDVVCEVPLQSAVEFEQSGHVGMTLLESLLFGLKDFTETRKNLGSRRGTLCTSTRFSGDLVPFVFNDLTDPPGGIAISFQAPDSPVSAGYLREVHLTPNVRV
jgi:hypothetical protein